MSTRFARLPSSSPPETNLPTDETSSPEKSASAAKSKAKKPAAAKKSAPQPKKPAVEKPAEPAAKKPASKKLVAEQWAQRKAETAEAEAEAAKAEQERAARAKLAAGSLEAWQAAAAAATVADVIARAVQHGNVDVNDAMRILATMSAARYVARRGSGQVDQVINPARVSHIKKLATVAGMTEAALTLEIDGLHQTYLRAIAPPPPSIPEAPPANDNVDGGAQEDMAQIDAMPIGQAGDSALHAAFDRYNRRFCLAKLGGKLRVIEVPDNRLNTEPARYLLVDSFMTYYANDRVEVTDDEGKTKTVKVAPAWLLGYKHRPSVEAIIFDPSEVLTPSDEHGIFGGPRGMTTRDGEQVFNLWRGFTVQGQKGDWSLLRRRLYENLCRRNPMWFAYTMAWIAGIVQDPCTKPEAAIAVRGKKGTGKTKVAEWIAELMPHNSVTTAKTGQVTGHFNAHHAGKLLLVSEESFWAGDKAGEAAMKHLITGRRSLIEPKGIDAYEVDDFIRLWTCSNSDWVFPASEDERRLFMLECSDAHKEDHPYFAAIDHQMTGGFARKDKQRTQWVGLQALMYDLQHIKQPTWVQLRKPPKTPWLAEQVEQSLPALDAWWLSSVQAGRMVGPDGDSVWSWPDREEEARQAEKAKERERKVAEARKKAAEELAAMKKANPTNPTSVQPERAASAASTMSSLSDGPDAGGSSSYGPEVEQALESFDAFCKRTNTKARVTPKGMARFLVKMGGRRERGATGQRRRYYALPELADARARFTKATGIEFDDAAHVGTDFAAWGLAGLPADELEAWRRYGSGETHDLPGGPKGSE